MKNFIYPLLLTGTLCAFKTDTAPYYTQGEPTGGITFSYPSNGDQAIINGIARAKEVLANDLFYKGIIAKKTFSYSTESAENIANELKKAKLTVRVRGYRGGEDTKTLAYVTSDFPTTIFINTSKKDRKAIPIANTLIHELIHILDRATPDARFGHGGNSSNGKKNSAPYWIGAYAAKVLSGDAKNTQKMNAKLLNSPNEDVIDEGDLVPVEETETLVDAMMDAKDE